MADLCGGFLRNRCTDQSLCKKSHAPLVERSICAAFIRSSCTYGIKCWYRHDVLPLTSSAEEVIPFSLPLPRLILQVIAAKDLRILESLSAVVGVETCSVIRGARRCDDRLVLVHSARDAVSLLSDISIMPGLRGSTPRVYAVDTVSTSVEEGIKKLSDALAAEAVKREGGIISFRVHAFPRRKTHELEKSAAEMIDTITGGIARPTTKDFDVIACLVDTGDGRIFTGLAMNTLWVNYRCINAFGDDVLCRAQRKLSELTARLPALISGGGCLAAEVAVGTAEVAADCAAEGRGVLLAAVASVAVGEIAARAAEGMERGGRCCNENVVANNRIAVDLGAAPGGWSAELARSHGIVFAVDPADLNLKALPNNVSHARARASDAVKHLIAAGLNGRVTTLVCDANVQVETATCWIIDAIPLLSPGAALILSAKNFDGGSYAWKKNVTRLESELTELGFRKVQRVHLFANGPQEVTIIGWWKDDEIVNCKL
jgi:hypothetical protein